MTTGTQVVIPGNIPLPAYLQTPGAAAEIAAANAAAVGGIKAGGFPSISIKAGKFHEKEGGELKTYMQPALPGQSALPLQCLEVAIVAANPALTKTYYPGDYVEGSTEEPTCRSSNGITPDDGVPAKQHDVCATCPQNQWGSKISKLSGKEIKACDDQKQLAILPAADLSYKALGFTIGKGSIGNWGKFVRAMSGRGYPVDKSVVNVTFDATATGVLQFAFNRFLTEAEAAKVKERAQGDDVAAIVAQHRVAPVPQLAPPPSGNPIAMPGATVPIPGSLPAPTFVPMVTVEPQGPQFPPATAGFGASAPSMPGGETGAVLIPATTVASPATPPAAEPPKRTRRTRAQIEADNAAKQQGTQAQPPTTPAPVNLSYLPPAIQAAVNAVGADSVAGQALLAQFPRPAVSPTPPPPAASYPAPVAAPATAPTVGFGATQAPVSTPPAAGVTAAAMSLKEILQRKLGINQPKVG